MKLIYNGKHSVEAYASLMNAQPVAAIVTKDAFKVGHVDSNLRFHEFRTFTRRTDAMRCFANLCLQWADA